MKTISLGTPFFFLPMFISCLQQILLKTGKLINVAFLLNSQKFSEDIPNSSINKKAQKIWAYTTKII
jgi:hypothetical protein